jgi:hypothetical protein
MAEPDVRRPLPVQRDHRRAFADNRYVYAVVSRRSRGLSIGVNLNPDKVCNFDCVYCQVDRTTPGAGRDVDVPLLCAELEAALDLAASGEIFATERFRAAPPALRRLNDIAFAGDGEPTTCPEFPRAVEEAAAIKRRRGLDGVKLILITNASMLHRPAVKQALETLHANNGEVWAKLDAGTEAYYRQIERTTIPFDRIVANVTEAARAHPLVVQALFLRLHGRPPAAAGPPWRTPRWMPWRNWCASGRACGRRRSTGRAEPRLQSPALALRIIDDALEVGKGAVAVGIAVFLHRPLEGPFQGRCQPVCLHLPAVAQVLQVFAISATETLQFRGRQVVDFELPDAEHFPVPGNLPAAPGESARKRWQTHRHQCTRPRPGLSGREDLLKHGEIPPSPGHSRPRPALPAGAWPARGMSPGSPRR